ncbi:4-hydroxy-tetrahydrodipicolinate reductase [Acutalibacter caecimuris]|uniref:4-hydroxy-tetrahydrodipicolinate reductase n=1 Tax=Acutalibacter caecimuris TaxID=3093657 RepID=UPI002AC91A01|nr:4-hydroxy-tetrahydrodipicolinate reductase [Acutalibacter sp. M00118]
MIKLLLCGCTGKMGAAVRGFVNERPDCTVVAGVDLAGGAFGFPVYRDIHEVAEEADVVVDFSHPSALTPILSYCRAHPGTAAVLCTTGYSPEQAEEVRAAAKELPVFYSRNMSLGINLLMELAKTAGSVLGPGFDVEILEAHHNQKIDAPSGTALMLADAVNQARGNAMKFTYDRHSQRKKRDAGELGIHSIRGGTIVGEHQVIFAGRHEVITLSHSAQSKELFAAGAVNAAVFMAGQGAGLYDMSHLVHSGKEG